MPNGFSILRSHAPQHLIVRKISQARTITHRDYQCEADADIAGRAADCLGVVNELWVIRSHVAMDCEADAALRHPREGPGCVRVSINRWMDIESGEPRLQRLIESAVAQRTQLPAMIVRVRERGHREIMIARALPRHCIDCGNSAAADANANTAIAIREDRVADDDLGNMLLHDASRLILRTVGPIRVDAIRGERHGTQALMQEPDADDDHDIEDSTWNLSGAERCAAPLLAFLRPGAVRPTALKGRTVGVSRYETLPLILNPFVIHCLADPAKLLLALVPKQLRARLAVHLFSILPAFFRRHRFQTFLQT